MAVSIEVNKVIDVSVLYYNKITLIFYLNIKCNVEVHTIINYIQIAYCPIIINIRFWPLKLITVSSLIIYLTFITF